MMFAWMSASIPAWAQGRAAGESPASKKPPTTIVPQTFPAEQILAGQTRFIAQCGFCHGRDAAGGEAGPDLTRSMLVAEDVRGDKIGPVIREGRPDKGMPGVSASDADIAAMVAFIHDAKAKAETLGGGRRAVDVSDLQTGSVDAGERTSTARAAVRNATPFQGISPKSAAVTKGLRCCSGCCTRDPAHAAPDPHRRLRPRPSRRATEKSSSEKWRRTTSSRFP